MNVTNSILKYYGCPIKHASLEKLDGILDHEIRNIVYILVDALGLEILNKHPEVSNALRRDLVGSVSSVFPPTTVAATTSVLTGLTPAETGWIGWSQYVKEEDKTVIFFTNKDYYDEGAEFSYSIASKYVPIEQIYEQIVRFAPDVRTKEIFPAFREPEHDTFIKQTETIVKTCLEPGRNFVYCYWDKLDTLMHEFGPDSSEVKKMLESVDAGYANLIEKLPSSSLVVLIADHGQIAVEPIPLRDYTDLFDTFLHEPSVESRATAFFIKPDRKKDFEKLFNLYFRDKYALYKTEDLLKMQLFGEGTEHPRLKEFLGDYMALAIDKYYFQMRSDGFVMKGQHAGLLAEETFVPLIINEKK